MTAQLPSISKKTSHFILVFLNLFVIAFWYFSFDGFEFFDDYTYAKYAIDINEGSFDQPSHHFAHRWAIIYPVALIFKTFGFSEYTMILWPLICTVITLNIIYLLTHRETLVAVAATAFFVFDFYSLYFSKLLYPDSTVTCFSMLALGALYMRKGRKKYAMSIILVFSLMIVFLTKLTVVYLLPFLALVFVMDIRRRKNLRFWLFALLLGGITLGSYFTWYELVHDNAFFRFQTIQDNHYVWAKSYFDKPFSFTLSRITYTPFIMLIGSGISIVIILASPSIRTLRRLKLTNKVEGFWGAGALLTLLMFWFSSTSFQYYNPIALGPRHLLMIVPMCAILGGINLKKMFKQKGICLYYAFAFTTTTVLSFWFRSGNISLVYVLLSICFWMLYINQTCNYSLNPLLSKGSFYFVFLILMIHPVYHILKPPVSGYAELKYMVNKYFNEEKGMSRTLVITDTMLEQGIDILYGFNGRKADYLAFKEITRSDLDRYDKVFILKDSYHLKRILRSASFEDFDQRLNRWGRSKDLVVRLGPISVYMIN